MSQASVIGSNTVVRGNVRGNGSLEILGRVEGDVSVSGDVVVGEGSAVKGNVSGAKITVRGAVQGDLRGTEAVLLEGGAKVAGDLGAPRIGIAHGALVRGTVRTEGEPALTPGKRPSGAGAQRPAPVVAKSAVKIEARPAPAQLTHVRQEPDNEPPEPAPRAKEVGRRPPPPVLPSLGKGAKAKKKKNRDRD